MFEREALFISFQASRYQSPAVKVSAGGEQFLSSAHQRSMINVCIGVNVLTGTFKNVHDAQVREQDYIVPGLQPWIDGAMTEEGVVRQVGAFSAPTHDDANLISTISSSRCHKDKATPSKNK